MLQFLFERRNKARLFVIDLSQAHDSWMLMGLGNRPWATALIVVSSDVHSSEQVFKAGT